jgi:hypothetical protein
LPFAVVGFQTLSEFCFFVNFVMIFDSDKAPFESVAGSYSVKRQRGMKQKS